MSRTRPVTSWRERAWEHRSARWNALEPDGSLPGRSRPASIWFPTVVSLVLQVPVAGIAFHGPSSVGPLTVVAVLLGVLSAVALLARRVSPGPVVVATGLLSASALAFGAGPPLAAVPLAIAVVSGTIRGARVWVWSTLAGVALVVPLGAYAATRTPVASIRPLAIALVLCFVVAVGEVARARRENYRTIARVVADRRRTEAEAERLRMARELHDVLAHSLSQISVQAGVGLHLFDSQPDRARASLEAIRLTSGQALEEVRGVLGFLRQDGAVPGVPTEGRSPAPDLSRLPELVESMSRSGLPVRLSGGLDGGVPPATQLALYRIVQEALTNAARHSEASSVTVDLTSTGDAYVAIVRDDGVGRDPQAPPGRGLIGMRERAELLGGVVETRSPVDGGFVVEARLPRPTRVPRDPAGPTTQSRGVA